MIILMSRKWAQPGKKRNLNHFLELFLVCESSCWVYGCLDPLLMIMISSSAVHVTRERF